MIKTWFPKHTSYESLKRLAELHALEREVEFDRIGGQNDVPIDRLIVNYLRHERTDYDEDQTDERHRASCEAIAECFPYLADECRRQVERRRDGAREVEAMVLQFEAQRERERTERLALVEESKRRISDLFEGQKVTFKDRRYIYEATIIGIGRSKVTVAYQVRTGKDRDRVKSVHAALVTPLETDYGGI